MTFLRNKNNDSAAVLGSPVNPYRNASLYKKHEKENKPRFDEEHAVEVERLHLGGTYEDQHGKKNTDEDVGYGGGEEPPEIPVLLFEM